MGLQKGMLIRSSTLGPWGGHAGSLEGLEQVKMGQLGMVKQTAEAASSPAVIQHGEWDRQDCMSAAESVDPERKQ